MKYIDMNEKEKARFRSDLGLVSVVLSLLGSILILSIMDICGFNLGGILEQGEWSTFDSVIFAINILGVLVFSFKLWFLLKTGKLN